MTGIELIACERNEQIQKHGRSIEKDVEQNNDHELSQGAIKMKTIFLIIIVSVLSACSEIEVKPDKIDPYAGDPVSSASKERGITIK